MKSKRMIIWILAGLVFLAACILRLYRFEEFVTFLGDQGRDAIIAKRIVTFENFPAIGAPSSVGQIYLGPFYYYLIAIFLPLFGYNPAGLAYGVALIWLIALPCIWYLVYKRFGMTVSLLVLIFLSFSQSMIELSRFSWNPNLLPVFSFFTFYFLYQWMKEKNWMYALLFGSFLSFTIQLHYLALLLFPTIGLAYLFYFPRTFKLKNLITQTGMAIGAFIFFSVPLILFDLKHDFLNARNFLALFTEGKVSSDASYFDKLQTSLHQFFIHSFQLTIPTEYVFLFFILLVVCFGCIALRIKSRFLLLNLSNFVIYLLGFALLSSPPHMHYFGPVYVSTYLLVTTIPTLFRKNYIHIILASIVAVSFIYYNFLKYPYFTQETNNQIVLAETIAKSFMPYIGKQPIQIVTIPFTETDAHYRYFLEIKGYEILAQDSPAQPEELFVMCFQECIPQDDPQWQIAAFQNKKVITSWKIDRVTIYKIIHGTP